MKYLLLMFLCSCGVVNNEQINTAKNLCETHNGISHMSAGLGTDTTDVYCNDKTNIIAPTVRKDEK